MTDLTMEDIRIDRYRHVQVLEWAVTVINVDAAAEATRYNCMFVKRDGQWWVMVENLQMVLPALPYLGGWHWTYVAGHIKNDRAAMALTLLMQYVHDLLEKGL